VKDEKGRFGQPVLLGNNLVPLPGATGAK